MKRICLLFVVTCLMFFVGCGLTENPEMSSPAPQTTKEELPTEQDGLVKYYIPEMDATISVPEEYVVFGRDIDYTDEMCYEAGLDPSQMEQYLALSFDQVQIIPRGDNITAPSIKIRVKVKDNKYEGLNFVDLSDFEYKFIADAIISGFSTDYSTLEKNGMKFMVFDWRGPVEMSYRYATIIDGDMIYIYATVPDSEISSEQRELLESIATSIEHK